MKQFLLMENTDSKIDVEEDLKTEKARIKLSFIQSALLFI